MGAQQKSLLPGSEVQAKEAELGKLNGELDLALAQVVIDIAGIADPTPISDLIGAGLSLWRGDFIGAGLSLISIVPYAGDALGKTAKGARLAKTINGLRQKISAAIVALQKAKAAIAARRQATAAVRVKRVADKAKKIADAKKCKTCKQPGGNRFDTNSPKEGSNGSWKEGERGNSDWHPDPNKKKGKLVLEATDGRPITFNNGHPDFSPFAEGKVEINMKGDPTDFTAARNEMRKKLNDKNWPGPDENGKIPNAPEGLTWHHNENGTTMELVPSNLNNKVPHTGGDSLVREMKKDPGY